MRKLQFYKKKKLKLQGKKMSFYKDKLVNY